MFGILKKKFSQLVESISKKTKEKEESFERPVEKKAEVVEKPVENPKEEVPILEENPLELKEEVEPLMEETKIVGEVEKTEELKEEIKVVGESKQQEKEVTIEPEIKVIEEEPKEKKSFFKKIVEKFTKAVTEKELTEDDLDPILNELETGLIDADTALEVAEKIKNDLRTSLVGKGIKRGKEKDAVLESLKKSLSEILSVPKIDLEGIIKKSKTENRPALLLFFGINGVGKSLNLSKVAKYLKDKGHQPILAAADTYRPAGSDQVEKYGEMIDVPVISQKRGADSCSVIFDARKSAEAKGYDVVLGDTSGRMHVKKDLLDELEKIVRVNKPDLKILVLDSLSGSDVLLQYEFFNKSVGIDAVFFSKIDVNEKGGNILSIAYSFKAPILFLGTGQSFEDLIEFVPDKFTSMLVGM